MVRQMVIPINPHRSLLATDHPLYSEYLKAEDGSTEQYDLAYTIVKEQQEKSNPRNGWYL